MALLTYREALNQALREEMRRDENVFLLGEDIGVFDGAYKVTAGLLAEFGDRRVLDTPIAEEEIVGLGIGAAVLGLRPVVELMTINFSLLAIDQIVNHAAKMRYMFGGGVKIPIVIRAPGGAGHQLGAQHSQNLEVWYAHVPGLKVVAPATPDDAKGLLKSCIRDDNAIMFIENEGLYSTRGEVPDGEYLVPIGKADVKKEGKDVTIIAHSRMTLAALSAATKLQDDGIDAEVVDLRTLRPMDLQTVVASVRKTNRAVTVEEGWRSFGVGAEVAASVYEAAFDYLDAPIRRVAGAEVPMPYAKNLENAALPNDQTVMAAVRELLERGRS
ncbi:MAG: pyruvate dehydrogenase complex E1 component subunit beta [Chloroflexi bacterium]|nr:pyruvate dehydrogenase complex E1 component subunit beta [Chloroflexota bacterium]